MLTLMLLLVLLLLLHWWASVHALRSTPPAPHLLLTLHHPQCHRHKRPTLVLPVVYREEVPREGQKPKGEGMFIVNDLITRLKEQGMLQLGNRVG